jgi:hypothetical protein
LRNHLTKALVCRVIFRADFNANGLNRQPYDQMSLRTLRQRATGTEGKGIDLASGLAFPRASKCGVVQARTGNVLAADSKNAVSTANGGI